jgi:hypothetical protein
MLPKPLAKLMFLTQAIFFTSTIFAFTPSVIARETKFFCGTAITENGVTVPATITRSERGQEIALILWVSKYFKGTPQSRCLEVSSRFQKYYENELLPYIRTDVINNLGVICVGRSSSVEKCLKSDVIVTLLPNVNRFEALDRLLSLGRFASGRPIYLTDTLIIYRNGEALVNVKIFMDRLSNPSEQ